jgi:photosystem II stability/assembly factor-like uncharacterized protein
MRSSHLPFKISTLSILLILFFSSQSIFAQSGWQSIFSNSIDYNFNGVHFKDLQNGLAIEASGIVFRTTNGGNNWIKIYENSSYPMYVIKYLNDTNVFVTVGYGRILRTSNYGDNWSLVTVTTSNAVHITKVSFFNELTGYAMGGLQYIQRTTNGGLSWDNISAPIGSLWGSSTPYSDMEFVNVDTGWLISASNIVAGGHGTIYENRIIKTTNGGVNWNTVYSSGSSLQFTRLKFFDDNTGWTWYGNSLYQTNDGGSSWNVRSQYLNALFLSISMISYNTGWMIGAYAPDNAICKTTNGGINWILQCTNTNSLSKRFTSLFIKDSITAWACGGENSIFQTTNGGGIISAINPISSNIPDIYSLKQNYPNPFNPTTKINFDLKNSAFAMLSVHDITGKEVRTLVNEKLTAGSYSYDFNASELPSGVYFYQLQTDEFVETKKMMLLK